MSVYTYLILLLFYTWKQFRFGTVFIEIGVMQKYSKRISKTMTYYYNLSDRLWWIIKGLKKLNFNKLRENTLYLYLGQKQAIIFKKMSIFIPPTVIIIGSHIILSIHCSFDKIYVPYRIFIIHSSSNQYNKCIMYCCIDKRLWWWLGLSISFVAVHR